MSKKGEKEGEKEKEKGKDGEKRKEKEDGKEGEKGDEKKRPIIGQMYKHNGLEYPILKACDCPRDHMFDACIQIGHPNLGLFIMIDDDCGLLFTKNPAYRGVNRICFGVLSVLLAPLPLTDSNFLRTKMAILHSPSLINLQHKMIQEIMVDHLPPKRAPGGKCAKSTSLGRECYVCINNDTTNLSSTELMGLKMTITINDLLATHENFCRILKSVREAQKQLSPHNLIGEAPKIEDLYPDVSEEDYYRYLDDEQRKYDELKDRSKLSKDELSKRIPSKKDHEDD